MWAICSTPGRAGTWSVEEFFRTGEQEIAGVLAALERLDLMPDRGRALDFGCGLGRLSRALASQFSEVVGVDISKEMIVNATRLNADHGDCRFVLNEHADLRSLPDDSFDLVLSLITLQHVSDRRAIRSYIREFARVAAPGGLIVFQLPARMPWRVRLHPRAALRHILWRLPRLPASANRLLGRGSLTLNALPERDVRHVLQAAGADVAGAFSDNRFGTDAIPSISYFARKS